MAYKHSVGLQSSFQPIYTSGSNTIHLRLPKTGEPIPDDALEKEINRLNWKAKNQDFLPELLCFAQVSHLRENGDMYFTEFCIIKDMGTSPPETRALPYETKQIETKISTIQPEIELEDPEAYIEHLNMQGHPDAEIYEIHAPAEEISEQIEKTHPSPHRLLGLNGTLIRPTRMNAKHSLESLHFINTHIDEVLIGLSETTAQLQGYHDAKEEIKKHGETNSPHLKYTASDRLNTTETPRTPFLRGDISNNRPPQKPKLQPTPRIDTKDLLKEYGSTKTVRDRSIKEPKATARPQLNTIQKKAKTPPISTTCEDALYIAPDTKRPNFKKERDHCTLSPLNAKLKNQRDDQLRKQLQQKCSDGFEIWVPINSPNTTPHFFVVKRASQRPNSSVTEAACYQLQEKNGIINPDIKLYPNLDKTPLTHPAHNMTRESLTIADEIARIIAEDAEACWHNSHPPKQPKRQHFKLRSDDESIPFHEKPLRISQAKRSLNITLLPSQDPPKASATR